MLELWNAETFRLGLYVVVWPAVLAMLFRMTMHWLLRFMAGNG